MSNTLTLSLSDKAKKQLEILQFQLQQKTLVSVLHLGVALLKGGVDARANGYKLAIVDDRNKVIKKIKLP